jgi:hypothetical protein
VTALWAILALARTNAREGARAPVTGVVLAIGLALTLAAPEVAIFTLGNDRGFVLDMGAGSVLLAAVFLAATTGALGTAERIGDGTANLILAQGTGAIEYVLGAYLGTATVLAQAAWLLGLASVHAVIPASHWTGTIDALALAVALALGVRASRAGRSFQTATFATLAFTGAIAVIVRALLCEGFASAAPLVFLAGVGTLLSFLAGCAYLGLGVLLATRLPPTLSAIGTLGAAVLGAALSGVAPGGGAARFLAPVRLVIPDLSFYSIGEAAYQDELALSFAFVGAVLAWTLAYTAGVLGLGAAILDRRELG